MFTCEFFKCRLYTHTHTHTAYTQEKKLLFFTSTAAAVHTENLSVKEKGGCVGGAQVGWPQFSASVSTTDRAVSGPHSQLSWTQSAKHRSHLRNNTICWDAEMRCVWLCNFFSCFCFLLLQKGVIYMQNNATCRCTTRRLLDDFPCGNAGHTGCDARGRNDKRREILRGCRASQHHFTDSVHAK